MMLYLKKCGRDIDYKIEKSQNIAKNRENDQLDDVIK